jgi:hypothetical protein
VLGERGAGFDARGFALDSAAGRSEHHVQILRELCPARWTPRLALDGADHVDRALAQGRGAVLWVAHFCFNALASKMALAARVTARGTSAGPSTDSRNRASASRR